MQALSGDHLLISRVAKLDQDTARAFAKAAHQESIFGQIPFSPEKFDRFFQKTIDDPDRNLGVKAMRDGDMLGLAHCYMGGDFIGEGARVASVNMINVAKPVRGTFLGGKVALKLVRAVLDWAKLRDAHLVLFYVSSGEHIAKTDRFFRKLGAVGLGGNYGVKI